MCSIVYARTRGWITSWTHQSYVPHHSTDILQHILAFASDPRHSSVCKLWNETNNNWTYALILERYRGDKLMSRFTLSIPLVISSAQCKVEVQKIHAKVMKLAGLKQNQCFAPLELYPIMQKVAAADSTKVCNAIAKQVPEQDFATVTLLDLNQSGISILPPQLGLLTNLRELHCSGNYLTIVPSEIGRLTHLEKLYLPYNQLAMLPQEIENLTNLELLELSNNQLMTLPPQIFLCTKLRTLYLAKNQLNQIYLHLTQFHKEVKEASSRALQCSKYGKKTFDSKLNSLGTDNEIAIKRACIENSLSKLQKSLSKQNRDQFNEALSEIEMVDPTISSRLHTAVSMACQEYMKPNSNPDFASIASNSQIKSFMVEARGCGLTPLDFKPILKELENTAFFKFFTALKHHIPDVQLIGNSMKTLSIKAAKETELHLYKCKLAMLPPEIGLFSNLNELYLQTNLLTILPPEIGKLTNLTRLSLINNQLVALPSEIGLLTNLKHLNLDNNDLGALPPEIFRYPHLKSLVVRDNRLKKSYFHLSQIHKISIAANDQYWRKKFDSEYNSIGTDNMVALKRSCLESSFDKLQTALVTQNQDLTIQALKEVEMVDPALVTRLDITASSEPGQRMKAWLDLLPIT